MRDARVALRRLAALQEAARVIREAWGATEGGGFVGSVFTNRAAIDVVSVCDWDVDSSPESAHLGCYWMGAAQIVQALDALAVEVGHMARTFEEHDLRDNKAGVEWVEIAS